MSVIFCSTRKAGGCPGNYLKNLCTATSVYSINFNLPAVVPVLPLQSLKSCISRRQRSYLASELSPLAASNDLQPNIDMSLGTSAVYLKVGKNKMEKLLHGGIFICSCSLKKQHISLSFRWQWNELAASLYSKYKHCSSHLAFISVRQDQSLMTLYNPSVSSDSSPICLILLYLFLMYTFMSTNSYLVLTKSFPESISSSVSLKLLRAEWLCIWEIKIHP